MPRKSSAGSLITSSLVKSSSQNVITKPNGHSTLNGTHVSSNGHSDHLEDRIKIRSSLGGSSAIANFALGDTNNVDTKLAQVIYYKSKQYPISFGECK